MKKLIIATSTAVSMIFALALVQMPMADDTQGHMKQVQSQSQGTGEMIQQEPGQADGITAPQQDQWSTASSCRDASGTVHQRGSQGFEQCVSAKRQEESRDEQMGGEAPSTDTDTGTDMGTGSGTGTGTGTDTGTGTGSSY